MALTELEDMANQHGVVLVSREMAKWVGIPTEDGQPWAGPFVSEAAPPEPPPAEPAAPPADPEPDPIPIIQLRGEDKPRTCWWDNYDVTMLADLDAAVGGLGQLDLNQVWHKLALFWVCSGARHQMTLRKFGERFPWGGEQADEHCDNLTQGARWLWLQIT